MFKKSVVIAMLSVFVFAFAFSVASTSQLEAAPCQSEQPFKCRPCSDCLQDGERWCTGSVTLPCVEGVCMPPGGCDPLP